VPSGVVAVPTRRRIPSTVRISPSRRFPSGEDMLNCHVVGARNAPQGPATERPHASVDGIARQQRSRYNEHSLGNGGSAPSNGSRLSCGRNDRGRKAAERQTKKLASEGTQFFPTCERPAASSAC